MQIDITEYLPFITSITFTCLSSKCTIVLNDESTIVFMYDGNTSNEHHNKIVSLQGALAKVAKLYDVHDKTTIVDTVYKFVEQTTYTKSNMISNLPLLVTEKRQDSVDGLCKFMIDNREMLFVILVDKESFKRDYAHIKNAIWGYDDERLRGLFFHYVIFDRYLARKHFNLTDTVHARVSDNTKLLALGN